MIEPRSLIMLSLSPPPFCSSNPSTIFSSFALQLFLFSLVYFPSKMLGQRQICTHFTSKHYNMLVCLHFPLNIADNITFLTQRSIAQTKNFNIAEFDLGLNPDPDPKVSLQLVKPLTLNVHVRRVKMVSQGLQQIIIFIIDLSVNNVRLNN